MKKLTSRIKYQEAEGETEVFITPVKDEKAVKELRIWLVLFTLSGLSMLIGGPIFTSSREEYAMVLIFMVFWLYFEIKIFSAFRYRAKGQERIKIDSKVLTYTLEKNGRGYPKSYELDKILSWKYEEKAQSGFFGMINQSVWMIAGESVCFEYEGRSIHIGVQLKQGEAEHLIKWLKKQISKGN